MRNFKAYSPANRRRRGLASVLAMLFLVLFSTLAVGFYAATTLSAQVAKNERSLTTAQSAAESGMEFMRYQLGIITVPPNTQSNQLLTTVYGLLSTNLNGTSNMGTDVVTMANDANGNPTIYVPGNTSHFVSIDSTTGAKFQGTIAQSGDKLVVTVTGMGINGTITRGVQLSYQKAARASAIFNYGVASKGKITTGGASYIIGNPDPAMGSVLSTDMADSVPVAIGGKQVSGDISISNPSGSVSYSGASIGGTSDPTQIPQHIHIGVPA
ncbi:MAG TPA: pilus assembly PilX N-terminal domain-containing protein, partial [Tepidisphaeraceae bacterium]|nr:pilus assembly PilX N-terminal domain-containing protein [Tepidisphaeraceae bacterium]